MLPFANHRMKPKRVDNSPGKDIAMVFSHDSSRLFEETYFLAKE